MLFRFLMPAVLMVIQVYLLRRFWKWSGSRHGIISRLRVPVLVAFIVFNAGLLVSVIFRLRTVTFPDWFLYSAVYPFYWWHSATLILGVVLLAAALVKLPFRGLWAGLKLLPPIKTGAATLEAHPTVQRFDASRRVFLRRSVYGLTAATFGGTAYGMIVETQGCEINETTILVPGLPPEFSGYTIGLVTDVHSSMYMQEEDMRRYVRMLNDMDTDMIVVGGDLVNAFPDEINPFADAFSGLRSRDGAYGVLGNHDFFTRDPGRIAEIAGQAGIRMLRDEGVMIRKGDAAIRLLGIDDVGNPQAALRRIDTALAATPGTAPTVLMCHRPYYLHEAASRKIDVVLSGHTHGGQIVLGRFAGMTITPAALSSPYIWGLYRKDATQMYVSRGIGTVAVPVRLNCPPELTRIILKPA
jgi:predicted MPP superfamily phosphohydrolase